MELLITMEEFEALKWNEYAPLRCQQCGKIFSLQKKRIRDRIKSLKGSSSFCSPECANLSRVTSEEVPCGQCEKLIIKTQHEITTSKSGKVFCSSSCAATYNNTHKTHGTRRSKLEVHIEEMIRQEFPDLEIIPCDKQAIGLELDLYFPELRFAIEFNGIFHYEPIYGQDKLERIQSWDEQRIIRCYEAGIELCVIDSSSVGNATKTAKEKYWGIVKDILMPIMGRKAHPPELESGTNS